MTVMLQRPYFPAPMCDVGRRGRNAGPDPVATPAAGLAFTVPASLSAREPAEARGLTRDRVRLLVGGNGHRASGDPAVEHWTFRDLPAILEPGDLLVVNNSGTLPAALDAVDPATGGRLVLHVSTGTPETPDAWIVELRRPRPDGSTEPFNTLIGSGDPPAAPQTRLLVTGGATITLLRRHTERLWVAHLDLGMSAADYLNLHGRPIRYSYVDRDWPLATYQTAFATIPGSAEMPSAARPFTPELVARLVAHGIRIAPITLHTGVASPEAHEKPYAEWYSVPESTADLVNHTRERGGRVIAVGTTAVRALESAVSPDGTVRADNGWTELVITPERGVFTVDGLLTGFHEPEASHLLMLTAVAGTELVEACYGEALRKGYLWHEFGDVNLLLAGR